MELTENQLEKLYEMTELHFEWFQIYSPETKYEEVLEINHIKILDIIEECVGCTEEMIDIIMDGIIDEYKDMVDDDMRNLLD